jgi:hypothetical protein
MKVAIADGSAGKSNAEPFIFAILLFCCLIFSSNLYAQEVPEEEQAKADSKAEPATEKAPPVDVTSRLEEILKQNDKCMRCHKRDRTKPTEDGGEMSLQVHREDYLASAHAEVSCTSCHRAIGNKKHPSKSTNVSISSQRDYSVEMNRNCRKCHIKKYKEYQGSVHAAMISQGSDKAPLCTDCHSAHEVETMDDYKAETGKPCKNCHENIFNAYTDSVHGQARINGNTIRDTHIQSPICADCHQSHGVTALAIGDVLRTTCIGCHENVTLLHNQWLPNSGTHLDIVSCAVCHAPFAKQKFDLHLYDNVANVPVAQKEGEASLQEQLQAIASEGGDGDPLEIWKERAGFGQPGQSTDISLRSRMEVMSGVAAHQIANKSFAVRTCDSCHEPGSRQAQNVTVSYTQPDGRRGTFEANREVLSNVGAIESISDFYALGGNPNKLLDYLLLLALFAGIAIPVGHFTMGKMIKEHLDRGEQ